VLAQRRADVRLLCTRCRIAGKLPANTRMLGAKLAKIARRP
jgi:hypothetical protein